MLIMLVKLTRFYFERPDGVKETDKEIWLNPAKLSIIRAVNAGLDKYTELLTDAGSLLVEETPEEIIKQIAKLEGGK